MKHAQHKEKTFTVKGEGRMTVNGLNPKKHDPWGSVPCCPDIPPEVPGEDIDNDEWRKGQNRINHSSYRR